MHSTPKRKRQDDRRSRWEQYGDGHPYTSLPKVEDSGMTEMFIQSGLASQGGMGLSPLTWSEIKAFNDCADLGAVPRELVTLMEMSRAYCRANSKGGQEDGDNPASSDPPYVDRTANAGTAIIRNRERSKQNAKEAKEQPL